MTETTTITNPDIDRIYIFYNRFLSEFYAHSCYQQVCSNCYHKQNYEEDNSREDMSGLPTIEWSETIFFNLPNINPMLRDTNM